VVIALNPKEFSGFYGVKVIDVDHVYDDFFIGIGKNVYYVVTHPKKDSIMEFPSFEEAYISVWSKYTWCLHCETVHTNDQWLENGRSCPKCSASVKDAWSWKKVVQTNRSYPSDPVIGVRYPLYPK
jgi:hypothetical protein